MLVWIILCRICVTIPGVAYLGRYSLIVLGMPMPMILLLKPYVTNGWLLLALVALSMAAIIPVFKRLFPHMTAQKQLIYRK